jgi:2-polyprenyl-3-methyl-5-hydroxy-6-metoxy-1,4-benzoquinol methylase
MVFPFGAIWEGRRFDYLRCRGCGSGFVAPLPAEEDFRLMYSQSSYHDEYYGEASEEVTETRLDDMLPCLKPGGKLLDFGCGNGAFLVAARQAGFTCEGVELDPATRARAAANSGCAVRSIGDLRSSGSRYDVIHLGDVLEHLPAPAERLVELRALLADGGMFFIEGPLEDNPSLVLYASRMFGAVKKLRGKPLHSDLPPFHLFRTDARAQRRFFEERLGWQVRRYQVFETGWPYWLPGDRLFAANSAARMLKIAVGLAARGAAWAASPSGLRLGNRFAAVVAPV